MMHVEVDFMMVRTGYVGVKLKPFPRTCGVKPLPLNPFPAHVASVVRSNNVVSVTSPKLEKKYLQDIPGHYYRREIANKIVVRFFSFIDAISSMARQIKGNAKRRCRVKSRVYVGA